MEAPGLVALGAGVGHLAPFPLEGEDLDPGSGGVEGLVVPVGAGHLALDAACAFVGIQLQGLLHWPISFASNADVLDGGRQSLRILVMVDRKIRT
jgi:hypothetical protein